jgi:putative ABC transport system permease protein
MEIGPVFRALFHHKTRFWLIALEIALTLAVVVNCVAMIREMRGQMTTPTGLDVDNLVVVRAQPFGDDYADDAFLDRVVISDLAALRALPGVRAATATTEVPLSGSGSATGRRASDRDVLTVSAPYFVVSDGAIETFGVEIEEGRGFAPEDFPPPAPPIALAAGEPAPDVPRNVLLTRAMADVLFPEGGALGSRITGADGERHDTVVGIIRRMDNSWPGNTVFRSRVMLLPGRPGNQREIIYMVRAEPGRIETVFPAVEPALLGVEPSRIVEIETHREVMDASFESERAVSTMLGTVIVLLVLVTALGIVGLTSFSVTERTKQIGTRRALGATRVAVLRYFLVENWLVTGAGLAMGIAATFGLNLVLAQFLDIERFDWTLVVQVTAALWAVGLLAALVPALRSTFVSPVVATRSV